MSPRSGQALYGEDCALVQWDGYRDAGRPVDNGWWGRRHIVNWWRWRIVGRRGAMIIRRWRWPISPTPMPTFVPVIIVVCTSRRDGGHEHTCCQYTLRQRCAHRALQWIGLASSKLAPGQCAKPTWTIVTKRFWLRHDTRAAGVQLRDPVTGHPPGQMRRDIGTRLTPGCTARQSAHPHGCQGRLQDSVRRPILNFFGHARTSAAP
jgi:hypothetical protein